MTPTATSGPLDQTFGAKWITDVVDSRTRSRRRYTLTLGADNLFDVYPDRISTRRSDDVQRRHVELRDLPYNGISPFGFNGRFVYTRLSFGL